MEIKAAAIPAGPKSASRFPKSSYVLNPPGTRLKPATTFPNKDFKCPVKEGSWKPSVFRKAWADMSDSSEEEPLACEMPPPLPEAGPSSGRRALTGLSRRAYKRYRKYAFWKVRKGHGQQRPKNPRSCSESSSDLQSVAPCYDSLTLLRLKVFPLRGKSMYIVYIWVTGMAGGRAVLLDVREEPGKALYVHSP